MKNLLIFSLIILSTYSLISQNGYKLLISEVKIEGSSNVHDWVSDVTEVKADASFVLESNNKIEIQKLSLSIPVKGIISTKGSIMDNKTWKALKFPESQNIQYEFVKIENQTIVGNKVLLKTWGNLTVANQTRYIPIEVTAEIVAPGKVKFTGNKKLKMTSYGIDPPTALFGAMTTGDDINIVFSVDMESKVQI